MTQVTQYDEKARLKMGHQIIALFELWQVSLEDQHTLLGLPDSVRKRNIQKYGEDEPLPDHEEVIKRAEHLMGIGDALRTYFPNSSHARSRFLRSNSKKFPRATPLQIMVQDGLSGLIRIRAHLDCTYAWDISGSQV